MVNLVLIAVVGLAALLALFWGPTACLNLKHFFAYPSYGDAPLCPHCLAPVQSMQHFCMACGQPISGFAATDPILSIAAEGCLFRGAVRRPSLTAVVGLWLIAAPAIVAAVLERLEAEPASSALVLLFSLPWLALAMKATLAFVSGRARKGAA